MIVLIVLKTKMTWKDVWLMAARYYYKLIINWVKLL
jgi:hypothetical protein